MTDEFSALVVYHSIWLLPMIAQVCKRSDEMGLKMTAETGASANIQCNVLRCGMILMITMTMLLFIAIIE